MGGEAKRRRKAAGKPRMVDHFQRFKKMVTRDKETRAPVRSNEAEVSQRDRAKDMRALKKEYGLTRTQMGAIGAGHMEAPWEEKL